MAWLGDQSSTSFPLSWNLWWGENGTVWKVKDNGAVIHTQSIAANSPNAQSASATIKVTGTGSRSLVVELCNSDGANEVCTPSSAVTVNVSGGVTDPGCTTDCNAGSSPWDYLDNSEWLARKSAGMGANNLPYDNTTNKMVGAYFVEWGVYGRKFYPKDIPVENLTHIFYGFIPVCGPNESLTGSAKSALTSQCSGKPDYTVVVHDKFAALEKNDFDGTAKWDDDVKGIFAEMYRMKKTYPHIKVLPSVGGWTLSDPLYEIGINPTARATFIASIIDLIDTYDFFDGIDIDWEFPGGGGANPALGTPADGDGFATLMIELRAALDELELKNNRKYELTAAMSGGVEKLSKVNWEQAHPAMDYINLMTYDYYGAWSTTYGHQTGIYDTADALTPLDGFNASDAVSHIIARGVPAGKIAIGVAMYGRGWEGIQGGDQSGPFGATGGTAITGSQEQGFWEKGIMDYKGAEAHMMGGANGTGINGFTLFWDDAAKASYLWDAATGRFVTLDTQRSVKAKGNFVLQHNLGGVFAWEIDADNGNLLNAMHEGLGHPAK
ncbi:glycosyl hydrolase family 18 protein [Simiduia agarivorans]|uniref:glycosyl hydrolase family 18 protein n=1 Tax=Simiduia agarivorans TaxID=447471 RepID=UPI0023EA76C1|nr:glycosyl hydrolase family 18 protein [Simiduia agarivorans]